MCPWVITLEGEALATDESSYKEMDAVLPKFEGQKIENITISQDAASTRIQFTNGLEITTKHSGESDQWYLLTPTEILEVGYLCKPKTEPRQEK